MSLPNAKLPEPELRIVKPEFEFTETTPWNVWLPVVATLPPLMATALVTETLANGAGLPTAALKVVRPELESFKL